MDLPFHDFDRRLENVLSHVRASKELSPVNKRLIVAYSDEMLAQGLSTSRVSRLTYYLMRIADWLNKDFPKATTRDIKRVVLEIEKSPYAPYSKKVYKLVLRRLYKWLRGTEDYPPEVKWISLRMHRAQKMKLPEELLTEKEVQALIDAAFTPRDRAFVAVLYETGARVGELATRRLRHVTVDQYGARLLLDGKTGSRSVRIVSSVPLLKEWINVHPSRGDSAAYLWPTASRAMPTYGMVRTMLGRLVERSGIQKSVHPHLFRHSRATALASHLTEAQMKVYFGWVQGSDMAAVYVHLSGRDVEDAVLKLHGLKKDNHPTASDGLIPKPCGQCKKDNPSGNRFCSLCGFPLDESGRREILTSELRPADADKALDRMLEDRAFCNQFLKRLKTVMASEREESATASRNATPPA